MSRFRLHIKNNFQTIVVESILVEERIPRKSTHKKKIVINNVHSQKLCMRKRNRK